MTNSSGRGPPRRCRRHPAENRWKRAPGSSVPVRGPRSRAGGAATGPLEGLEDQVQSERELVAVIVAGLPHVLGRQLGQVWVLVHGEPRQDLLRELGGLLGSVERQVALLQREPVDVAVEEREGVGGQRDREAGVAKAAEDGVVMP